MTALLSLEENLPCSQIFCLSSKSENMGFLVKLDTNGSDPKGLQSFIGKDLVDYVAMDVKASPEEYPVTAGYGGSIEPILQSIEILKRPLWQWNFVLLWFLVLPTKKRWKRLQE